MDRSSLQEGSTMNRSTTLHHLASLVALLLVVLLVAPLAGQASATVVTATGEQTDTLADAVARTLAEHLAPQPLPAISVSDIQYVDNWAFGNVVAPAPLDSAASPRTWLFLAQQRQPQGWEVALDIDPNFTQWVMLTPPGLLSQDEQRVLGSSISPQGDGSGELSLPWPTGETWTLTGGPHVAVSGSVRNAIDFAGGSGRIVAARDGVAYYTASCPNYIRIEHGGGWKTTYYHAINIAVGYGQAVSRGQFLGNISAQSGCGGSATGPHVHFATYLNNADKAMHGLDIGGWTVENGASAYVGCMIRVRDGSRQCSYSGQIYN
ncbi:MAG: M23 family metallopeptidase, partial [Chloroflexia bacterium]|nr:M23 family metallopeptidase [Chloroflexia bacterium]